MKKNGTAVCVEQECLHCHQSFQWNSQPLILSNYPAGNVLLSFAILVSGASISKVLLVFRHMGLSAFNIRTFFRHQSCLLLPTMGHSAKYCAYTLINCTEMKIGHFKLLQVCSFLQNYK